MVKINCGKAPLPPCDIDVLKDFGWEPRKRCFQTLVTDANNYFRLLPLPDLNDISDPENPLCRTSFRKPQVREAIENTPRMKKSNTGLFCRQTIKTVWNS